MGFHCGNFAKITINEFVVNCGKNENDHARGLHLVVINPRDGKVVAAKVFDTYKSSLAFEYHINSEVPFGTIVVAACKDDCVT